MFPSICNRLMGFAHGITHGDQERLERFQLMKKCSKVQLLAIVALASTVAIGIFTTLATLTAAPFLAAFSASAFAALTLLFVDVYRTAANVHRIAEGTFRDRFFRSCQNNYQRISTILQGTYILKPVVLSTLDNQTAEGHDVRRLEQNLGFEVPV